MKKGSIILEMFSADDFSSEGMEEFVVPSTLVHMRLTSPFKGSDNIVIESKEVEGVEGIGIRLTKDNKNFNPNLQNDRSNKKFFTLSKIELKTLGNNLVKGQQSLKDDRIFRVSFIPK